MNKLSRALSILLAAGAVVCASFVIRFYVAEGIGPGAGFAIGFPLLFCVLLGYAAVGVWQWGRPQKEQERVTKSKRARDIFLLIGVVIWSACMLGMFSM